MFPRPTRLVGGLLAAIAATTALTVLVARTESPQGGSSASDPARSQAAFKQVASVLRHPRCMNCHTATEFPRQGDDRHRHAQLVMRGDDNHGSAAMRCYTCHQDVNQSNGVPGAPNWSLAPLSMAWEQLDDHQLAEALKDPAKNGHRTLEQLYDHIAHDELVGWGWHPGGTRDPVPMPRAELARWVREWIDTGAASPDAQ